MKKRNPRADPRRIETWFSRHQDGEFSIPLRSSPFHIVLPLDPRTQFLYATKPNFVRELFCEDDGFKFGIIARGGLPSKQDCLALHRLVRKEPIVFLGDLDAPDLLIFAWLRNIFAPGQLVYLGISDALLEIVPAASLPTMQMKAAKSEVRGLELAREFIPDLPALVGEESAKILGAGNKVELEGIASACEPDQLRRKLKRLIAKG